jgi:hypothetical protein
MIGEISRYHSLTGLAVDFARFYLIASTIGVNLSRDESR